MSGNVPRKTNTVVLLLRIITAALLLCAARHAHAEETVLTRHWLWSKAHAIPYETTSEQSGYFSIIEGQKERVYIGTAKYGDNAAPQSLPSRAGS